MPKNLKIVFAGTPEFAEKHLKALVEAGFNIKAVYTQPDRKAQRGQKLQISPVKRLAIANNLPIYQPKSLRNEESQTELASLEPDLLIVVAYGLILPQKVLEIPRLGCINVHGSILPRWRGAAPIHRAIEAGDSFTGITTMQMDAGLDTGAMLLKNQIAIDKDDTTTSLSAKLADLGAKTLIETLENLENITPVEQSDIGVCYAHKISKEELKLDFNKTAVELERQIRAFDSLGAFLEIQNADKLERIKIIKAKVIQENHKHPAGKILQVNKNGISIATAENILQITELKPQGKQAMNILSFINGYDWFQENKIL